MTDPIQGVNSADALGVTSTEQSGPSRSVTAAEQTGGAVPVDSTDVARAEALLSAITQAAAAVPPIDQTRVAELQKAINSGAYQPNPQQIAQKIVEIEALLASRAKLG
jgi:flagellar biosynthesis anti-sigma factor FlgM